MREPTDLSESTAGAPIAKVPFSAVPRSRPALEKKPRALLSKAARDAAEAIARGGHRRHADVLRHLFLRIFIGDDFRCSKKSEKLLE